MHHQDHPGDPPGGRKMSHPTAFHHRRGSSGASSSTATIPGDDSQPPAGSSSPGQQHQSQSQSQALGAQMKKKSGFQITSVTPAQMTISTNNSLADDTESYEDMDESHTEDLSNSDMLDVSVSRATDAGIPERSSSEETLNSLHGVETPGLVSPNEPLQPQAPQQTASMVNGVVHHHHDSRSNSQGNQHHDKQGAGQMPTSSPSALPVASSSPALVVTTSGSSQRLPTTDNTAISGFAPMVAGGLSSETHLPSNMSTATAPGQGVSPPSGITGLDGAGVVSQGAPGGHRGPGSAGGIPTQLPTATTASTQTQAAPGSRFRVVKLDSNSEPFRKGRWMCTEYYEKDIPPAVPSTETTPFKLEAEAGEGVRGPGLSSTAPSQTSQQPYQQSQIQGFTSGPQATQVPAHNHPRTQDIPLEPGVGGGGGVVHMLQQPIAVPSVTVPLAPKGNQAPPGSILQQFQPGGYSTTHLSSGAATHGGTPRQPDFIQPTAPFQTQAQPPLPHTQLQHFPQQTILRATAQFASAPLTTLRADLQPLLTHGVPLTQTFSSTTQGGGPMVGSLTATQLEDAQRLLFQQSILAGLPRLGATSTEGESSLGAGGAGGGLAHMGMGAEASALVAAAAGLRTQTAEGEEDSSSGASVVAIDNKIEQAMDLVKSHLMYAVREEVEVLKEQIKELIERNSQLEQENNLLKTLASPEQMAEFQAQVQSGSPNGISQPPALGAPPQQQQQQQQQQPLSLGLSLAPSSQSSTTSG